MVRTAPIGGAEGGGIAAARVEDFRLGREPAEAQSAARDQEPRASGDFAAIIFAHEERGPAGRCPRGRRRREGSFFSKLGSR